MTDLPTDTQLTLDRLLDALADPQRRTILRQIADEPDIVCSNVAPGVPRSTVSVQLRRLREAGLIEQCRSGQLIANRVRTDGAWAKFGRVLDSVLDAECEPSQAAPR